ncbi:MAG: 5'-nucleotidase C-terminal domain-containing protein [Bacteroidales bacterium]|nr:5'-nucleotidase C-terminal domain-containing protein [Bacteroidales bacterium]
MKRFVSAVLVFSASALLSWGQSIEWTKLSVDASRTGVVPSSSDNVGQTVGTVKGCRYMSPNGKTFRRGVTKKVAGIVIDTQPAMAEVKQVVAHSDKEMVRHSPECELYDWYIDVLISETEAFTGDKIDVGLVNTGGIRVDMPEGDVLADDIMSMFPFKNKITVVTLTGARLREVVEEMASRKPEVIGGMRIVIKDRKLQKITVGGEPLDDDTVYKLVTIDFLLNGGDRFCLGENMIDVKITDKYVIDVMLPYVKRLTAEGKTINKTKDNRVTIL